MIEDRLADDQCVRLAALEKAIDSFSDVPQRGRADTITFRASEFEKYLKDGYTPSPEE